MTKVFNDVLYGYIQIDSLALSIIDKPEFQRLRQLRQLGMVHYVFPSANHSRFEHSIGTYHLAGLLLRQIKARQPELEISERMISLVQCAALLHDVGHVAFSHLFDHCLANDLGVPQHEARSIELVRTMVAKYSDIELKPEEVDLICLMIVGKHDTRYPAFLFEIVANSAYQLDVDKCDYLVRDAHHLGISSPLQIERIFSSARVLGGHICYHKKVYLQVLDIFMTRYRLHKEVYKHHAVVGIELQLVDILKIVADVMDWKKMFAEHKWIYITDSILDTIPLMRLEDPFKQKLLERAQTLFERLQTRKFYKIANNDLNSSTVTVKSVLGFSSSFSNPMDALLFYESDFIPHTIKPTDISKLLSNKCVEVEENVYRSSELF